MQVSILGGGGFLGRKLAARLARDGAIGGRPVTALHLFDLHPPPVPDAAPFPVRALAGDLLDPAALAAAMPPGTGVVFHLAAVVSAAAEADFDLGMRVNLDGTRAVLDRCRALVATGEAPPRVVFTSSVASFSGGQDGVIPADGRQLPANSYGVQKAMGELLLGDASRRGFLDAVCLRLPTVLVRPGRPNRAASSFVSAILREPLLDLPATLPVPEDFALWLCSPRRAMDWLLHAAALDSASLGLDRGVNPPGLTARVSDMLGALERVAGPAARARVQPAPDPAVAAIVSGWPAAFDPARALSLGFAPQEPLEEILRAFVADDLDATRAERAADRPPAG
ncbi:D-erythronate dehydrogenase [Roseomonas sp. BN140053]|uniref:D-erythronate dehydrogenase n=1 Tax=Roseomonas sp. BN140053 TaxID=3391898 RepID=UPI0039ECBA37